MKLENKLMDALVYGNSKQIEKVFEEIYYQYYKLVYFCIKQNVDQKEDIEELTNDTFVSFYNVLDRYSSITSIKAYLCKIASNKVNDFVRKKKIDETELKEELIPSTAAQYGDIFDFLKEKLNEEEYYILVHHSIYEETFKEIALDMNASTNTVKSTYRRLIKKLKGENYENY